MVHIRLMNRKSYEVLNRVSDVTHIEVDRGFWCLSEENNDSECEDYRVSFCCPTFSEGSCSKYGSVWQSWIDRDDPDGVGDIELRIGYLSVLFSVKNFQ